MLYYIHQYTALASKWYIEADTIISLQDISLDSHDNKWVLPGRKYEYAQHPL